MSNPGIGVYATDSKSSAATPPTARFDRFRVGSDANDRAPTVEASAVPATGEAPLAVTFAADATDPEGDDLTHEWDSGVADTADDTSTEQNPTYTYANPAHTPLRSPPPTRRHSHRRADGHGGGGRREIDTAAPLVRELVPRDGAKIRDRAPKIGATVLDYADELAEQDLRLYVDGKRVRGFDYYQGSDKLRWAPGRKVGHGRHTVRVVAEDASDNRSAGGWDFRVVRPEGVGTDPGVPARRPSQ